MYYRQAVLAMAAVVVPPLVPPSSSSCQLQALVGNGGPCVSLRPHHNQVWRLRGPATSGGGGSGYMAAQSAAGSWRLRVTAESAAESVETEAPQDNAEVPQGEEAAPEAPAESAGTGDQLTMMLRAEGSMPDISIPTVKQILEEMENVSDVNISTFEGLTSITLTKKTVIQATNVASELVDAMEKGGFRLHTLNLAIDDEE